MQFMILNRNMLSTAVVYFAFKFLIKWKEMSTNFREMFLDFIENFMNDDDLE